LTLPGSNKYNFVSGNYWSGGRNGCIYHISSPRFEKEKDAWLPDANEHTRWQKNTQEQKGKRQNSFVCLTGRL
jgi:hypothetical protein